MSACPLPAWLDPPRYPPPASARSVLLLGVQQGPCGRRAPATAAQREAAILRLMRATPGLVTLAYVCEALADLGVHGTIAQDMTHLCRAGRITRVHRGAYRIAR